MDTLPGEYEAWLIVATDGLAPESIVKVRTETAGRSWAELGDPIAANRRYRRRYLSESDLRSLQWLGEPPTMKASRLFFAVIAVLALCLGGYWILNTGLSRASFPQAGLGLAALLAAQLLFMMAILPQALRYGHLAMARRWGTLSVVKGYAILWGAAAAAALITPIVLWTTWLNFSTYQFSVAAVLFLCAALNTVLVLTLTRRYARTAAG